MNPIFARWMTDMTVTRVGAGSWVDGEWEDGADDDVEIRAVVQDADGSDIDVLPIAMRERHAIVIWTDNDVFALSCESPARGDVVTWKNRRYRVARVAQFEGDHIAAVAHYKATAVLLLDGETG